MTRTYARETVSYTQADIDALVAADRAQYFPGLPGYVIDRKQAVRMHQIVAAPVVEDDNAAEAALADAEATAGPFQHYLDEANAAGISLGEYTDGEYFVDRDGVVRSAEERLQAEWYDKADAHDLRTRNATFERAVAPAGSRLEAFNDVMADFLS